MTARPRIDRTARRAEIVSAASSVFAQRGVANTAVSEIVKAAGVAQGTFYLYFATKDDVLLAVVEQMVADLGAQIERRTAGPDTPAVERLLGLRDALRGFEHDASAVELAEFLHRDENRALHDRLTERLAKRLVVIVEDIVAQGVAEGVFSVSDTHVAAWFVLGGLQSVEASHTPATQMPAAIDAVTDLALRALGYQEATS